MDLDFQLNSHLTTLANIHKIHHTLHRLVNIYCHLFFLNLFESPCHWTYQSCFHIFLKKKSFVRIWPKTLDRTATRQVNPHGIIWNTVTYFQLPFKAQCIYPWKPFRRSGCRPGRQAGSLGRELYHEHPPRRVCRRLRSPVEKCANTFKLQVESHVHTKVSHLSCCIALAT